MIESRVVARLWMEQISRGTDESDCNWQEVDDKNNKISWQRSTWSVKDREVLWTIPGELKMRTNDDD